MKNLLPFYILTIMLLALSCNNPKDRNTSTESLANEEETETSNKIATLELEQNATLGEGAFWNHQTQELYWIDILQNKLHIYNPKYKTNSTFNLPSMIGTVVPQTDSTAVVALEDGIYIQNIKNGSLQQISDVEANKPENQNL